MSLSDTPAIDSLSRTAPGRKSAVSGSIWRQVRFALRSLGRDLRSGELRVLALALIIAVASVTAVGFFTDRIGRAVERQAADVLAADLLASSGFPIEQSLLDAVQDLELATAQHVRFPSVVINERDESQLVAMKAVSDGYPLRGNLKLASIDNTAESVSQPQGAPARDTVWVDAQLSAALALQPGDTLTLGEADFLVSHVIMFEPDRGQSAFEFAPRAMINLADLEKSALLGEGSRARFSLLMAGGDSALDQARDLIADRFAADVRVQGVRDGDRQMNLALDRAQRFLGLATVVTVLLAGAAVALAVRHFAWRQADASAVMRTLGASRAEVIIWLSTRLALVALSASLLGVALGWAAQLVLAGLLRGWFDLQLPAPGMAPPLIGICTAFIALAGFGLLPVIRAGRVNVMQVLQRDYRGLDSSVAIAIGLGLLATYAVVLLLSGDWLLSAIVVLGVAGMLAVFGVFGRLIIAGVRRLAGPRMRMSTAGLQRRQSSSIMQLAAFAMGIMALLLISIVRVDLLAAWEQDVPPDAPNVFVVNIQPDQVDGFATQLQSQEIDNTGIYPMVRARLIAHNGESVVGEEATERDLRRARREYNLSFSNTLPLNNEVVAGQWWADDGNAPPELSIEREWAERNGFEIGDTLTFKNAGVETTATISNWREVDWESFQVNFFVIASPTVLEGLPATYVTSFHIKDDFVSTTTGWVRQFPGIATLDIGAIINRVKSLMDRASLAVEYVFLFTLFAGLCVLLAAVQSSQGERKKEAALLRALGASHQQLREAIIVEFAILGAVAGLLAAIFASVVAWSLSVWVFELPFNFNIWLWIIGIVGGALGIAVAGYLATRRVLFTPPIVALRHAAS
ncbi:MAG: FtsX-like permease family protein [Granulosicoccus sp.]|nr:FtsX-like permease family protein [Granulosicoccus sp.]